MKLKRLLLLIWLISLLGLTSLSAQEMPQPTQQPTDSLTRYGLEPGKSYPEEVVAQLLDAIIQDARAIVADEVAKAYNEGYKAGSIDFAPNSAYWEAFSAALSREAKPGPTLGTVAVGTGAGVLVGFVLGIGAAIVIGNL